MSKEGLLLELAAALPYLVGDSVLLFLQLVYDQVQVQIAKKLFVGVDLPVDGVGGRPHQEFGRVWRVSDQSVVLQLVEDAQVLFVLILGFVVLCPLVYSLKLPQRQSLKVDVDASSYLFLNAGGRNLGTRAATVVARSGLLTRGALLLKSLQPLLL